MSVGVDSDSWESRPDEDLIQNALQMWANYIETGNPITSARDAQAMGKKFRALGEEGMALVLRLRELAKTAGHHGYSQIADELKDLPMTYYPALLGTLVAAAMRKRTFKPGQIHVFVKNLEDKWNSKTTQELQKIDTSSPTSPTTTRSSDSSVTSRKPRGS